MNDTQQTPGSAPARIDSKGNSRHFWEGALSRRGILAGAAALATGRWLPAQNQDPALAAALGPPFAYVGCYTGGAWGRGNSLFFLHPPRKTKTLVGISPPPYNPPRSLVHDPPHTLFSGG